MTEDKLHWEDFEPGNSFSYGRKTVTREEILVFAREFDPQPFHLDDHAASQSHFGGLVASGWQTGAFCMRLIVDNVLSRSTSMGSPGITSLRWLVPVRPGDTLTVRQTILRKTRHPRRPEMGFVDSRFEALNQNIQVVLRMESAGLFRLRHPAAAP